MASISRSEVDSGSGSRPCAFPLPSRLPVYVAHPGRSIQYFRIPSGGPENFRLFRFSVFQYFSTHMPRARSSQNNSTANLGFEAKLWLAADKLRSNMDAAEYKVQAHRGLR